MIELFNADYYEMLVKYMREMKDVSTHYKKGELYTFSGIPRDFNRTNDSTLVEKYKDLVAISNQSIKNKGLGNDKSFRNIFIDHVFTFRLFNVHQNDNYVAQYVNCVCDLDTWFKLQQCEACVVTMFKNTHKYTTSYCFIMHEIKELICPKDGKYDYFPRLYTRIYGYGVKQSSGQIPLDDAIKILRNKLCGKTYDKTSNEEIDVYYNYLRQLYESFGDWCVNNKLPYDFVWNLLKDILNGLTGYGRSDVYRDIIYTMESLLIMEKFIIISYLNLELNKFQSLSFDFIFSVCADTYCECIENYIDNSPTIDEYNRATCLHHYNQRYNDMMKVFDEDSIVKRIGGVKIFDKFIERYFVDEV